MDARTGQRTGRLLTRESQPAELVADQAADGTFEIRLAGQTEPHAAVGSETLTAVVSSAPREAGGGSGRLVLLAVAATLLVVGIGGAVAMMTGREPESGPRPEVEAPRPVDGFRSYTLTPVEARPFAVDPATPVRFDGPLVPVPQNEAPAEAMAADELIEAVRAAEAPNYPSVPKTVAPAAPMEAQRIAPGAMQQLQRVPAQGGTITVGAAPMVAPVEPVVVDEAEEAQPTLENEVPYADPRLMDEEGESEEAPLDDESQGGGY